MYSSGLVVGSWVDIGDGRPIRFEVGGSGVVYVTCGRNSEESFQLSFDPEALREFLRLGSDALREMDAIHARELAEDEPV
ncbi:MAG TPA: hypothetical protein VGR06_17850 [Actinophytocola sp.]|jgi:hypothetical protein|uniref:hypothetical protein n=1 Tax=Actinophytocola sp. TaxID=1872138 RepID=UPI002E07E92A|nr:hypothetical protein [Actinophytocola sp.]